MKQVRGKKVIAVVLLAALLFALIPVAAMAADAQNVPDDLTAAKIDNVPKTGDGTDMTPFIVLVVIAAGAVVAAVFFMRRRKTKK